MINVFNRLKRKKTQPVSIKPIETEEEYYKKLFTESDMWSKAEPNYEEVLRWQIIEKFLYYIKGYQKEFPTDILDLGCGRGWLSNLLSKFGNVTGIEPIKPVVEHANKLFPQLNISCGTSKDLINNGYIEKFDLVVSSEVIEHIPDEEKPNFILDIRKLVKKDGFVLITTPRKEVLEQLRQYSDPSQPIEDWLSENDLLNLFKYAGFEEHLCERFSIKPQENANPLEIYQLWLFKKVEL